MSESFDEALRRSGLDVTRAANLMRLLSNYPLLDMRVIDVKFLSGVDEMDVYHGLLRPHTGAIVIGSSDPVPVVSVDLPREDFKRIRVRLSFPMVPEVSVRLLVF